MKSLKQEDLFNFLGYAGLLMMVAVITIGSGWFGYRMAELHLLQDPVGFAFGAMTHHPEEALKLKHEMAREYAGREVQIR